MRSLALVMVAGCAQPPPSWHVDGGFLRDPDGRAVILRGVNLAGANKNAPYLDDKQPADYARVRTDWGMNAVRFIMTWAAVEPQPGRYDDAYLDRVAERIGWANDANLSVIVEMHEDIYGEGFGFDGAPVWSCDGSRYAAFVPQTPWYLSALDPNVEACIDDFYTGDGRQHFIDVWAHVAERFAKLPAIIGFDVLNEPNWGTYPLYQFERDRLEPLYADAVTAVRRAAPTWVAFVEPSASRNAGVATGLRELPFANAMYAPHSYDANAEGGGGFDPSHRQMILDNIAELADEARALGAGLWIGEYGGDSSAPGIADYMTAQYDAAGQVAGSTMYWSYDKGGSYSLLDEAGNEKPELLGVLVRPYPERVAGDPISYAFDAATQTFTFTYSPDGSRKPTEISVPARVYPNGYQVDCDCELHQDGASLVIDSVSGDPATIALHP